jgi:hypothetical protein
MAELVRRWDEEHARLRDLVLTLRQQAANSPDMASRYRAMQTRPLGSRPPARPRPRHLRRRCGCGSAGVGPGCAP